MNTFSRRTLGTATAALLLAGLGHAARGQPGPGPRGGPGPMGGGPMGGGMMGRGGMSTTPEYLDGLKARLGITPKQEPAWKEYADTVNGASEQMRAMHQTVWESMGTADWEERRNMMNGMFASREQTRQMVQDAAQKLLPELDKEQQAKAETMLPGLVSPRYGWQGMGPRRP
jgi:hypothetical protein